MKTILTTLLIIFSAIAINAQTISVVRRTTDRHDGKPPKVINGEIQLIATNKVFAFAQQTYKLRLIDTCNTQDGYVKQVFKTHENQRVERIEVYRKSSKKYAIVYYSNGITLKMENHYEVHK